MAAKRESEPRELVGVLPAAGTATRLGRLPCSKEILPLGLVGDDSRHCRVRVAIEDALDGLWAAGVQRAVIVLAPGKEDIRQYLGDGADRGLDIAYETLPDSPGSPWSVNAARDRIGDADTALVFPDIRFEPMTALAELRRAAADGSADLWLALVPSNRGHKVDLVRTTMTGGSRPSTSSPARTTRAGPGSRRSGARVSPIFCRPGWGRSSRRPKSGM